MTEYKCGDCFHADLCKKSKMIVGFSRDNPAYCGMFLNSADVAPVVRCKDCKHQCKIWHADKRMKEKGYWIYSCKRNSDHFVSHTVNGYDDEYCCYGERKKGEDDE